MGLPKVSIIVPCYKSANVLSNCFESALAQRGVDVELIAIDNGADDETKRIIERYRKNLVLIKNAQNVGFARANNQGIEAATGEYILFLNDDASLTSDYCRLLVDCLDANPKLGSAIGKLKKDDNILDSTGIFFKRSKVSPYDRGEGERDLGQYDRPEEIPGATCAAAMYRKKTLDDCRVMGEIFDEDFFAYYEDVDLAWRAQVFGWRCFYVPNAIAYHGRRGPFGLTWQIKKHLIINRYFCYIKNEVWQCAKDYIFFAAPWELARISRRFIVEPRVVVGGVRTGLKLWRRMLEKRKDIMKRRRATIEYLRQLP